MNDNSVVIFYGIYLITFTMIFAAATAAEVFFLRRGWTGKKTALVMVPASNFLALLTGFVILGIGFFLVFIGAAISFGGDNAGARGFVLAGIGAPIGVWVGTFIIRLLAVKYIDLDGSQLTWRYALGSSLLSSVWISAGPVVTFVAVIYLRDMTGAF